MKKKISLILILLPVIGITTVVNAYTINDGDYLQYVEHFSGTLTMGGGTIVNNLYIKQDSSAEICGGYIGNFLVVDQTSDVLMYGGHVVAGISSPYQGEFSWYGGVIDGEVRSGWRDQNESPSSHHIIYGLDFELDGTPITDTILNATNGTIDPENYSNYLKQSYWLTGTLSDGSDINNELIIYGDSTIELVIVPEPASIIFLGSGFCIFLRKPKNILKKDTSCVTLLNL